MKTFGKKFRIAVVSYRYSIEVSPTLKNICSYLYDHGFGRVDVFVDRLYRNKDYRAYGANITTLQDKFWDWGPLRNLPRCPAEKKAFQIFLRENLVDYDVVFAAEFLSVAMLHNAGFDLSRVVCLNLEGADYIRSHRRDFTTEFFLHCAFFIAPSKERADDLQKYLGANLDFEYLPVSLRPVELKGKSHCDELNIIYSGYFAEWAGLLEFLEAYRKSGAYQYSSLLLQGHSMGTDGYLEAVRREAEIVPRLKIDTSFYEDKDYMDLLAKQDVGVAFYKNLEGTENFTNLIFSSGKIASYLWSGLAVLTNVEAPETKDPPFIYVRDFSEHEIKQGLRYVRDNRKPFRDSAYELASKKYNFDTCIKRIVERVSKLCENRLNATPTGNSISLLSNTPKEYRPDKNDAPDKGQTYADLVEENSIPKSNVLDDKICPYNNLAYNADAIKPGSEKLYEKNLAGSAYRCGNKRIAEKAAGAVMKLAPDFAEAKDLLKQLGGISEQEVGPGIDQPENNCAEVTIKDVDILKGVRIYCDAPVYDEVGFDNCDSQTNGENALLPFLTKQGDIVFDVGANRGEWSKQVLSAVGSVQIHSFEPVPDTFALLKQVLGNSGVFLHNVAVSDIDGEKTFYYYNKNPDLAKMSSFYRRSGVEQNLDMQPVPISVQSLTLDSFCKKYSISHIDFLKIDTEGAELDVLQGAVSLLKEFRIRKLQFEYGGTYPDAGITLRQMCELLSSHGYTIFRILPDGLVHIGHWHDSLENNRYSNYLAVSPEQSSDYEPMNGFSVSKTERSCKTKAEAIPETDTLSQLEASGLWNEGKPLRLHLGCGQRHFDGYVNIDYPPSEHTVQSTSGADIFADIRTIDLPDESVDEIRSHHVFEHFDRQTALVLLCRWHRWLKAGGVLIIETPDFEASLELMRSPGYSYREKQSVLRHIFGSHEADWAVHRDGWYREKFEHVLRRLGFDNFQVKFSEWQMTRNIIVTAHKSRTVERRNLIAAAKQILRDSMVDESKSEEKQWQIWSENFEQALDEKHGAFPKNEIQTEANSTSSVVGIIFSKDRAMQLDATIRSFLLNCKDHHFVNLNVIYKVSNSYHKESYNKLIKEYKFIEFFEEEDFRKQLLCNLAHSKYVLFLVDDNIFVKDFRLSEIAEALQKDSDALGFSLRLGKNINYHYPSSSKEMIPPFIDITGKVLKYDWTGKNRYFGYPLEVSSSVYRTDDVLPLLTKLDFQGPNTLEAEIARSKNTFANSKKNLLCFQQSVTFCNPVNVVQDVFPDNRSGNKREYSPDSLARMFNAGYRIDVAKFLNFIPSSCHQEVQFEFIKSNSESSGPGYNCPTVSIYMAVYNSEQYLAQTLDSILSQTFRDFEIIIADDGSMDHSAEILKRYEKADSRIRILQLPHVGVVEARNEAIKRCNPNSKYLMNHDSDDMSSPTKLARLVEYLETHPEIAIVSCFAEYFDDEGNFKGQPPIEWLPERIRQTFGEVNSMIHSASLIRRQVFEKIGSYSKDFPVTQDYDFFARALMAGFELANIPEVLHKIRLHPKSIGNTHAASVKIATDRVQKNYKSHQQKERASDKPRLIKGGLKLNNALSILHTVEFYSPHVGGAELVVQQLSERLVKRGHRVTVATTKLADRAFAELNGVQIEEFDVRGAIARGFTGSDISRYQQFLLKHPSDIMMNYAAQQWATDLAFDTLASTSNRRVSIIAPCGYSALSDSKTLQMPQFADYFNNVIPAYLPRYDAVVYHSRQYQDYEFAQNHGFKNSVIIPNGVCEEEFSQIPKVAFRQKYKIATKYLGLCVANFYSGKGQDRVINCVRQMNRTDFTMVFIGKEGGQLADLQALATGLNIRFCTDIERQDVLAAYHEADIFLFGSEKECSPLVIVEAKASRTPFVSTDCGNVREWKGGVVCAPEKMAVYANRILDEEIIHRSFAEDGWKEWKEKLTWESVIDRYEQLYSRLCFEKFGRVQSGTVGMSVPSVISQLQEI